MHFFLLKIHFPNNNKLLSTDTVWSRPKHVSQTIDTCLLILHCNMKKSVQLFRGKMYHRHTTAISMIVADHISFNASAVKNDRKITVKKIQFE